jgi:hypothetical protein
MTSTPTTCFAQFFYRVNPDKSMDAVCGCCFASSEPTRENEDLRAWQAAHHCAHLLRKSA